MRQTDAAALEAQVWRSLEQGDLRSAINACEQLNRQFPEFASGWHTASHLASRLGNREMALDAIRQATRLDPENPTWMLQEANCLVKLGRVAPARALARRLAESDLKTAYENAGVGMLFTQLNDRRAALEFYAAASALEPNDARHYFNIASLQRTLGDLDAAEQNFDRAVELAPQDFEAYKLRSELRKQTADRNHVTDLEALLAAGIDDPKGRANIGYALAKELEDLGESERSFEALLTGASARRGSMQYDVARDIQTIEQIRKVYSPDLLATECAGHESREPIFILGMPRTGTTLLERILGSHSDVHAAGELANFAVQMSRLAGKAAGDRRPSRDELVEISAGIDFAELGRDYLESTRPETGMTARFIDKLPLNYLYVGLIHRALPNATIIHVQRDPMDTCYAVFKTLFKDPYPFSYDLEELARYYVAYHELMEHWHAALPGVLHTVRYEDLVGDIDREARSAVEACGLEWQDACLEFHKSKEASTTASAAQIRQPVYSSSVGRWHDYEQQLQPVYDILRDAGIVS